MADFRLTARQDLANEVLASPATHIMLYGGSRSGKTFLETRAVTVRAIKAPASRHVMLRFRFNAIVSSIVMDTFPKVMAMCHPGLRYEINKSQWFAQLWNGSQIWFGGLDDKERTEKILGNEYATILLNECSQIPWGARNMALTRLAQKVMVEVEGQSPYPLPLKMYYDENPPDKAHWSYKVFELKVDPETREPLPNPEQYKSFRMNPADNAENLPDGYIQTLQGMGARMRRRFLDGEYREANPSALFNESDLDKWRVLDGKLPDFQRIVIAADPSGAGDVDNADNDEIGVMVGALGTDGNGYVLEDLTLKAGPATWGKVIGSAFDRHGADVVVGETNYGGAMVQFVVQTARPRTPFKMVTASRGKVVRAEPISALVEQGKVRLVGYFQNLEDELAGFSTNGYTGAGSPNRADAFVWLMSELFPGIVADRAKHKRLDMSIKPSGLATLGR
jgi:phage terminase large subunit-like protein